MKRVQQGDEPVANPAAERRRASAEESMKIFRDDRDGVVVLQVSGKLMGGPDAEAFQDQIKGILDEGGRKILVDLGEVSWVNSTGLGILIAGHSTVTKSGGDMKLCKVSRRVESILMVTRLNMIFESYTDEAQALASF
jgi:anti-sigma B factor antagonist